MHVSKAFFAACGRWYAGPTFCPRDTFEYQPLGLAGNCRT